VLLISGVTWRSAAEVFVPQGDNDMKVLKVHALEKGWCDKEYLILHAVYQFSVSINFTKELTNNFT